MRQVLILLIGAIGGETAAGGYRVASQLGQALVSLAQTVSKAIYPELVHAKETAHAMARRMANIALIAGVHPLVGLGSTLVVGLNCALFGGRPGMVSGASATCALVVAPLGKSNPEAIPTAVVLAGLLQLAIGYLKGGRLVRMLPHPVVLGFVNGSAQISAHG